MEVYHERIRGCSVHQGYTINTFGHVQYTGGIPWFMWWKGDIMSTFRDVQYIGGISLVHWGIS